MVDLVGRERLVATLVDATSAPGAVAVWGPAGVGKSALARRALPMARWCDVAGAADPEAVAVRVARALGVPVLGRSGADLDASIGAAAGAAGVPLVLDGAESDLRERIAAWQAEDEGLRVVLTTRDPAPGLRPFAVGPLATADGHRLLQALVGPSGADDPLLALIAERVDGLPLVLHYAARAVSAVGTGGVLALLRTTGLPPLESLLDAAWSRLAEGDRRALVHLAAPEVALDAVDAAALVGDGVLEAVGRLRDAGLVRRIGDRLEVSHAVRDHVRRRGPEALAEAGGSWAAAATARVADALVAWEAWGDPVAWQLLAEREAATTDALRVCASADERLVLLLALEPVVLRRGPYGPCVERLATALGSGPAEPVLEARATRAHAELLAYLGRVDDALTRIARAETQARACGRSEVLARTLIGRAWIELHEQGRPGTAALVAEAQALARALPDRRAADHLLAHACVVESAVHAQAGQGRRAVDAHHRAARHARAAGDRAFESIALRNAGDCHVEAGDPDQARALLTDALELVRLDRDERGECRVLASLGVAALDGGDPGAALPVLDDAAERARRLGDRRFEGIVGAYVGIAHVLLGAQPAGRAALDRSIATAIRVENRVGQAFGLALRACVHAIGDDPGRALSDAAAADRLAAPTGHAILLATVAVARTAAIGADARAAEGRGDPVLARLRWAEALPVDPRWSELATGAYDLRLTLRLRTLALASSGSPGVLVAALPGLEVAEDGAWFERDGARVDLQARGALRRILATLAEARVAAPDGALPLEVLFSRGWPGERAVREAARNRVYSAVYGLRKLGLEDWLVRRDDGWCLDPSRPVRVVPVREGTGSR